MFFITWKPMLAITFLSWLTKSIFWTTKKIMVSVGNFDYDSRIILQNANSESTLYAIIKDTNGNQITIDNNVIGEFDNTEWTSKSIYTEVYYDSMAKAGTYTGYIDFYVEVIEK